jgi:hypothetical protein
MIDAQGEAHGNCAIFIHNFVLLASLSFVQDARSAGS